MAANQRPTTLPMNDDQLSNLFNDAFIIETHLESYEFLSTSYPNSRLQHLAIIGTTTPTPSLAAISSSSSNSYPFTGITSTAASASSLSDDSQTSTIREEYQIRTLGPHNFARLSILPIFPYFSLSPTTQAMMSTSSRTPHLLLSNVPIESLTQEQYTRIRHGTFPQLFKFEMDIGTTTINPENNQISSCESFLICLYQNLYVKLKKRLKVDIPILDFNLTRLHNCINKVVVQRDLQQTMLNNNELALALEFYLQIDVDMFFLKTCSFNDVKPRLFNNHLYEGVWCLDKPEARFAITPCDKQRCLCCHSPCPRFRRDSTDPQQEQQTFVAIPFSIPHIHRFVNQYEAILNCPATCETKNCIYVLTCPCSQFDFIGTSKVSFAQTLTIHREEGNRIIREFLIGEFNIDRITHGLHSNEKKTNDKMWLYQHSPRCSVALQLFLDYNPDYWCFVPMKSVEINIGNIQIQRSSPRRTNITARSSPLSLSPFLSSVSILSTSWTRTDEEVCLLLENVPKPPFGFDFSIQQRQQQIQFFKWLKDRIVPLDNVDLYNADIVAILPKKTSELFQQLIESLLITHAECKLNEIGHLVYENSDPNHALHGSWCANLTRRPVPSLF